MTDQSTLTRLCLMLLAVLALGACAIDDAGTVQTAPITGRQVTQNAPAPDYTVEYWSALRACLQTGRSEWACKSGEDRFVRDALAIEAELSAQRQQRRKAIRARADLGEAVATDAPGHVPDSAAPTRSMMLADQGWRVSTFIPIAGIENLAFRENSLNTPTDNDVSAAPDTSR